MRPKIILAALLTAAATTTPMGAKAQSQDPNLGRNLAANCANCHGTNGASVGGMPGLAGRPRAELLQTLREFRDGKRPATIMHQLAKGYNEAQLEAVSAYLAAQKSN
jgi:sulfide dehydrogenase cytochrome subunit